MKKLPKYLVNRIVDLFLEFPKKINSVDERIKRINEDLPIEIRVSCDITSLTHCHIVLIHDHLGSFFKWYDIFENSVFPYSCTYYPDKDLWDGEEKAEDIGKADINTICECMVRLLCTNGKDKDKLPLICHIFPKLFLKVVNKEIDLKPQQIY